MKKGFLLISGLLVTSVAYSSVPVEPVEPLGIDSLINLQGVVVSANKIQVNRNSVPLSISVIDREEIEASRHSFRCSRNASPDCSSPRKGLPASG